jgi:hypothetical protein
VRWLKYKTADGQQRLANLWSYVSNKKRRLGVEETAAALITAWDACSSTQHKYKKVKLSLQEAVEAKLHIF